MAAPAYLTQDASFRLDLSCLLDEAVHDDEALDAVKAIDILAGHWPSDTLQEVTSLDQSQLLALQVHVHGFENLSSKKSWLFFVRSGKDAEKQKIHGWIKENTIAKIVAASFSYSVWCLSVTVHQ